MFEFSYKLEKETKMGSATKIYFNSQIKKTENRKKLKNKPSSMEAKDSCSNLDSQIQVLLLFDTQIYKFLEEKTSSWSALI